MSVTPQTLASELLKKLTPTKFSSKPRNDLTSGQVEDLANFKLSPANKGEMEIEDDIEDIEVPDYPNEGDNTDVSTPFKEVKAKAVWKKQPGGDFSSGKKSMILEKWLVNKQGKSGKESARKIGQDKGEDRGGMLSVSSREPEEKTERKSLFGLKENMGNIEEEDDIETVEKSSGKKRSKLLIDGEDSEQERIPMRNLNEIWGDGKRERSESGDEKEESEDEADKKKKQYKKVKNEKEGKVVEKKKKSDTPSKKKEKKEKKETTAKKRGAEEKAKAKKEAKAKKQLEEDESEDDKPKSKTKGSSLSNSKEQSGQKKTVFLGSRKKESVLSKKKDEPLETPKKKKGDVKLVKGKGEKDSKGKKDTKEKAKKKKSGKEKKEKKVKKTKKRGSKKKKDDNDEDEADDEEEEDNDSDLSRLLEGDDESDDDDNDNESESDQEMPFTMIDGQYVYTGTNKIKDSEDEEEDEDEDKPGSYWKKNVSVYSSQRSQRRPQSNKVSPYGKSSPFDQLKSSKKVLMFSGLAEDDVAFLYAAAKKLGNFDIQTLPLPQMSHLIYDGNKRTIKVLYALAKRAWILEKAYVYASYEFGDWVPEKDHESSAFPTKKDREAIGPLFKDIKFFFKSTDYQNIGLDEFTVLVKLAGGIICQKSSEAELVIENGEEKEDFMVLEGEESNKNQKKILHKWILDSLSKYNRLPLSGYLIKSGEESD